LIEITVYAGTELDTLDAMTETICTDDIELIKNRLLMLSSIPSLNHRGRFADRSISGNHMIPDAEFAVKGGTTNIGSGRAQLLEALRAWAGRSNCRAVGVIPDHTGL
jgi:hypothetical protein